MASELLKSTNVDGLIRMGGRSMIEFGSEQPMSEIIDTLIKERIYAGPVRDKASGELIGVVSVLDVLQSVLEVWSRPKKPHPSMLHLVHTAIEHCFETGATAAQRSNSDALAVVRRDATLDAVIDLFSATHIHRVFRLTEDGAVNGVVTQSDIVNFLDANAGKLGAAADASVASAGAVYREVAAAKASQPVRDVFERMVRDNLRAVPVVDGDGVIGVISSTDFHLLAATHTEVDVSTMTALELLQTKATADVIEHVPAFTCSEDTTLREALHKFRTLRVHRIYVVKAGRVLVGVVTLGAVLRALRNASAQ